MQSPNPVKVRPLTIGDLSETAHDSGAPPKKFDEDSYDEEFLKEIDGMALTASISEDVIPTIFYTPGCPGSRFLKSRGIRSYERKRTPECQYRFDQQDPPR